MTIHEVWPETPRPKLQAGDTVLLRNGTHTGCLRIDAPGVLVTNAPGEDVILTSPGPTQGESAPHSLWLGGVGAIVEEHPAGGEFWISHPVGTGAGMGFRIAADHCHIRNIRCRGVSMNVRNRCLGGSLSGLVSSRSGWDPPGLNDASGYVCYIQNVGDSQFVVTDLLSGVCFTTALHIFGGSQAARRVLVKRSSIFGAGSMSKLDGSKASIVVNEENSGDNPFDDIEIEDCVVGAPYRYPEGGGWAQAPIAFGGDAHSTGQVNGRVRIKNCDLIGRPYAAERIAWADTDGNRIFVRLGSDTDSQGWSFASSSKLLHGPRKPAQVFSTVGYPNDLPRIDPQVRVWANPTEPGRAHVSVIACKNERSVSVNLAGIIERGKKYSASEINRETREEFRAGAGSTVTLQLPDISPAGVTPARDPHPIVFQFLIRRA